MRFFKCFSLGTLWFIAACSGNTLANNSSGFIGAGGTNATTANSSGAGSNAAVGGTGSTGNGTAAGSNGNTTAASGASIGASVGASGALSGSTSGNGAAAASTNGSSSGCGCSLACCSDQSSASSTKRSGALTCQDGSVCYGGWYCQELSDGSGGCSESDPCSGQSGVWNCGPTSSGSANSSGNSSGSAGASGGTSGGALAGGSGGAVTLNVPSLSFATVGDTRPSSACSSTSNCAYPTSTIQDLYTDIKGFSPAVSFVVATGDYQYNTPGDGTASWQVLQNYLPAAQIAQNAGIQVYPTMGNHECNGYTASNCTPGGGSSTCSGDTCGITENLTAFLSMLSSLGIPNTNPYYAANISIAGGYTAKFVFIAANAWSSAQSSWLTSVLSQPSTYTFLIQHEANNLDQSGSSAPSSLSAIRNIVSASGTPASGQIYPVTLWIVGHTHNYDYDSANQQVINGLGGAPSDSLESSESSSTFYSASSGGYGICTQQSTGSPPAIQCSLFAAGSSTSVGSGTTFAVNADGSPATVQ